MSKVLFVSAHYPSLNAKYAGHKTAFQFLKEYSDSGDQVDVVVIANKDEFPRDDNALDVLLTGVKVVKSHRLSVVAKLFNIFRSGRLFPLKVNTRYSYDVLSFIRCNIDSYDVIHFEFTHAAVFLPYLTNSLSSKHIVVSSHDILFQSSIRKNGLLSCVESFSTFRFEREIYDRCTKIIVQSLKDKDLLASLYSISKNKIEVKTPYISDFVYKVKTRRISDVSERAILFWGAMNRQENIDAVLFFCDKYGDYLKNKAIKLYIVGANPSKEVLALASDFVIVTGFVEDPSDYFVRAKVGIVPLISGAGIKVKTLEMLAAGLPVASTEVGAEGIEHESLYLCDINGFDMLLDKLL